MTVQRCGSDLARAVVADYETDFQRAAAQLHDETVQRLVLLNWLLDDVDLPEDDAAVAGVRSALSQAVDSVRSAIVELVPASLIEGLVVGTLRHRAEELLGDGVTVRARGELPTEVPTYVERVLYRSGLGTLRALAATATVTTVEIAAGVRDGWAELTIGHDSDAGPVPVGRREVVALAGGRTAQYTERGPGEGRGERERHTAVASLPLLPPH